MGQQAITATYFDPQVNAIRNTVATKNADVPFLLLPVRVETRFMLVDKPIVGDAAIIRELLERLFNLTRLLRTAASNPAGVAETTDKTLSSLRQIAQTLARLHELLPRDRDWLLEQIKAVEDAGTRLIQALTAAAGGNRVLIAGIEKLHNKFDEQLDALRKKIALLPAASRDAAAAILKSLTAAGDRAAEVNARDLSGRRAARKRQTQEFLDKQLATISQAYVDAQRARAGMMGAGTPQIEGLRSAILNLRQHALRLKTNGSRLPQSSKREQYGAQFGSLADNLDQLAGELELSLLPELNLQRDLKWVDAGQTAYLLTWCVADLKTAFALSAAEQKRILEGIADRLTRLAGTLNGVMLGTQYELQWVDEALKSFQEAARNAEREISIGLAEPTKLVSGALSGAGTPRPLTRTDFSNASQAYSQASTILKDLSSRVAAAKTSPAITADEASELLDAVIAAKNELQILTRQILILPLAYRQALAAIPAAMQGGLQPLSTRFPSLPGWTAQASAAIAAVAEMARTLAEIRTDVPETGGARAPMVAAMLTESKNELWVRVYPDEIAISSHEEDLTAQEIEAGKDYWRAVWLSASDSDIGVGAWRALSVRFGAARAAWIVKKLKPVDLTPAHPGHKIGTILGDLKRGQIVLRDLPRLGPTARSKSIAQVSEILKNVETLRSGLAGVPSHPFLLNKALAECERITAQAAEPGVADKLDPDAKAQLKDEIGKLRRVIEKTPRLPWKDWLGTVGNRLQFPTLTPKAESWTQPPRSNVMPDRFVVVTMNGGKFVHVAAGGAIGQELIVGLNPAKFKDNVFQLDPEGNLQVDPDIKWLTDFQVAVEIGMSVVVPLSPEEAKAGFEKLLVLGIKDATPEQTGQLLERIFDAHRHTSGLSFLPVGTPTNNAEDAPSGYSSAEDFAAGYGDARGGLFNPAESNPAHIADGQRLARALGISPEVFQTVHNSGAREISESLTMNRALWPVTLGSAMEETLENVFSDPTIDFTRDFFTAYVNARGFLPSLRIGRQPYGILPTTAFSRLLPNLSQPTTPPGNPQQQFDVNLALVLAAIYEDWKVMAGSVKQVHNLDPANVQREFIEMLGLQATSVEYYTRFALNCARRAAPAMAVDLAVDFRPEDIFGPDNLIAKFASLAVLDNVRRCRAYRSRFLARHALLQGPTIRPGELSETGLLRSAADKTDSYIDVLLGQNLGQMLALNDPDQFTSRSLLYLFLRQSLLLEYRHVSLDILTAEGIIDDALRARAGSPEYYIVAGEYITKWAYLFKGVGMMRLGELKDTTGTFFQYLANNNKAMADYLNPVVPNPLFENYPGHDAHDTDHMRRLKEVRAAIADLAEVPTAHLDKLLAEHIDLCSYRLDAWLLGLVNRRLLQQRTRTSGANGKPAGVFLGAFAWLEDLTPGNVRAKPVDIPKELYQWSDPPVFFDQDNQGFVHAPSISSAVTGAILRSGYKANSGLAGTSNPAAVNLSSERVRAALRMLEGVNQGHDVGELLGYQFERGLHDGYPGVELDQYIYPLRRAFPLRDKPDPAKALAPADGIHESSVINGLALLEQVRKDLAGVPAGANDSLFDLLQRGSFANCPTYLKNLQNITPDALTALAYQIDRMADTSDALADLLTSESVYQIVQGNHARAASVMAAISEGKRVPEPEIINTPRTGTVVTLRVPVLLDAVSLKSIQLSDHPDAATLLARLQTAGALAPNWETAKFTARALADPNLNRWLGGVLGKPDEIGCVVEWQQNGSTCREGVTVQDLNIQPVDFIHMMSAAGGNSGAELKARIAYCICARRPDIPPGAELSLKSNERLAGWATGVRTLYQVATLARNLCDMTAGAKPLGTQHLSLPGSAAETHDADELQLRLETAIFALNQVKISLTSLPNAAALQPQSTGNKTTYNGALCDTLRAALMAAAEFNFGNAIPATTVNEDPFVTDMVSSAQAVLAAITQKMTAAQSLVDKAKTQSSPQRIETLAKAGKLLFGDDLSLFPLFTVTAEHADALRPTAGFPNMNALTLDSWLQSSAKVRQKMSALEMVSIMADSFKTSVPLLTPAQLPYDNTGAESWAAADYRQQAPPAGDCLCLVLVNASALKSGTPMAGFLLDEWGETIPRKEELTAVSFNYDQPDSQPAQSMLLAVSPADGQWNWDDLVYTLLDTLELAKCRGVEPDHIEQSPYAQVLPAIMSEVIPRAMMHDRALTTCVSVLDLSVNNLS